MNCRQLYQLHIRTNATNSWNSSFELSQLQIELNEATPSNFRIGLNVELRTTNSNPNWSNHELGNYVLFYL